MALCETDGADQFTDVRRGSGDQFSDVRHGSVGVRRVGGSRHVSGHEALRSVRVQQMVGACSEACCGASRPF